MKKFLYLLVFLMFIVACDDEPGLQGNISSDFHFSDCISEKSASTLGHETVEYKYAEGNKLLLVHKNVYFNCCQPENNLQTDVQLLGDSIIINEYEKELGQCKCICPYHVNCEVNGLLKKEYWIIYQKEAEESFRFLIDFNEHLDGSKSF